jgi:hypothetical protein
MLWREMPDAEDSQQEECRMRLSGRLSWLKTSETREKKLNF